MAKTVIFRALMEVLGKPKEHVEQSLKGYIQRLKEDKNFQIVSEDYAEIKKREEEDLWATFVELELKTDNFENLVDFCFQYMPSSVEVLEPQEFVLSQFTVSYFLGNLQARLHQIDMVAKQVKFESEQLKKTASTLLKNYLLVLLTNNNLGLEQLSKLTGVNSDKLGDFLDKLIDEGKIGLREGIYFFKKPKGDENGK